LAIEILRRIESTDAYADILLEDAFAKHPLKDVDKGLLTELVYGVLRWRERVDWVISLFSSIRPARMERDILNILRLGAYQLLFLDRIPASAAVNESVKIAKVKGERQGNFVNAVLRAIDRGREGINYPEMATDPVRHISVKYSHPEWLVRRFIEEIGIDDAVRLCLANNEPPPLTIRVNTMAISREGLLLKLNEAGYEAAFTSFSPVGLVLKGGGDVRGIPGFAEGLWSVQDEASQLVSFILDPRPEEKVLDACAAPGGKATHIAELMADRGEVVAMDVRPHGVRKIEDSARRLGLKSARAMVSDASEPLGFRDGEFDRILLDAPCSGTGVLRRHPEGKWRKREVDIPELAERQEGLMENLSRYLRPGGITVYSVCSIMKEEGKGVVESFLAGHPEFTLEPAIPKIGGAVDTLICDKGFFKVYSHMHGMDGFFAAKLKKIV
jgi:16S rRNA (cytosine967-C5)-methyltransferase